MLQNHDDRATVLAQRSRHHQAAVLWREIRRLSDMQDGQARDPLATESRGSSTVREATRTGRTPVAHCD